MYMYIYMCMYICVLRVYIYIYMNIYMYTCVLRVYIYIYMYIFVLCVYENLSFERVPRERDSLTHNLPLSRFCACERVSLRFFACLEAESLTHT